VRQKVKGAKHEHNHRVRSTEHQGSHREGEGKESRGITFDNTSRRHPFTENIIGANLPPNWKGPMMDRYDRLIDSGWTY